MTDVAVYQPDDDDLSGQPYDAEAAKTRSTTTTTGQAAALMLVSGSDFDEIAQILDLPSAEVARRITERALAGKFDSKDRHHAKRLLLARYEALFTSAKRRADNPKYTSREAAAGNALKALDNIARVMGLNEPTEVTIHTPVESEIIAELHKIAAMAATGLPEEADVIEGFVVSDDPS